MIRLHRGDCLDIMPTLDGSFDVIIADLPYGTTACKWDTVIPFEPLWEQYKRLIKPKGAIVLFGSQPFTSALVMSNPEWFKYELIWEKTRAHGFLNADYQPLRAHENMLVFSPGASTYSPKGSMLYNPQFWQGEPYNRGFSKKIQKDGGHKYHARSMSAQGASDGERYPRSVIKISNPNNGSNHATQKPIALLEYLVRTYTNEGETVLDNCFGSCTTGIACLNTARNFVGIEKDEDYFRIGQERIKRRQMELGQIHLSYGTTDTDRSDSQEHLPPVQIQMPETVLCGGQG